MSRGMFLKFFQGKGHNFCYLLQIYEPLRLDTEVFAPNSSLTPCSSPGEWLDQNSPIAWVAGG